MSLQISSDYFYWDRKHSLITTYAVIEKSLFEELFYIKSEKTHNSLKFIRNSLRFYVSDGRTANDTFYVFILSDMNEDYEKYTKVILEKLRRKGKHIIL